MVKRVFFETKENYIQQIVLPSLGGFNIFFNTEEIANDMLEYDPDNGFYEAGDEDFFWETVQRHEEEVK